MYKIAAINLGSTSTKFAYYENDTCVYKTTIEHSAEDLRAYPTIWDQLEFRVADIADVMAQVGVKPEELSAIVTRGGHSIPLEGGVYRINKLMLEMSASEKYGNHATDLGLKIATAMAKGDTLALTVDPPVTDEFGPLAKYTGIKGIRRQSRFHALNHRAAAKQYAKDAGKDYANLNLIGVHMGGGITICAHEKGKMVDANNGILGDGPFSTNRTGTFPSGTLIDMCFSGEYDRAGIRRLLNGGGGLMSYLGENDVKTVEQNIDAGDSYASEVLEALCYQISKEVGAMAAVLSGKVDAIYLTGGIAHSKRVTGWIRERVEFIAPVALYPGEFEMQSLALGAYNVLCGVEEAKELKIAE